MICPCGGQCKSNDVVRDAVVVGTSQKCEACGRYELFKIASQSAEQDDLFRVQPEKEGN